MSTAAPVHTADSALARFHVELRSEIAGNKLTGHAAVFGQIARVPGGWEEVGREAFDAVLKHPDTDVVSLKNHDPDQLLGRQSAGTLRVSTDSEGLPFEVDLPNTTYANDLRELVERGDLTGASFGFVPGDDVLARAKDGRQLRRHTSIRLLRDVGPVTFPAYEGAGGLALRHHDFTAAGSTRSRLILARHRALRGATT